MFDANKYFANLVFGQLCCGVIAANPSWRAAKAPLLSRISNVLRSRSQEKMAWVHAPADIAPVAHIHAVRGGAVKGYK